MRAVFDALGVKNVSAKCHGSTNPYNIVRATLDGLSRCTPGRRRCQARQDRGGNPGSGRMSENKTVKVTLVKSLIGRIESHQGVRSRPGPEENSPVRRSDRHP